MKILDPQQAIVFDGLDMFGENDFEGNLFTLETIAEGMDWGAPEPDVTWLENILRDGAIAYTQGHKNREVNLKVKVKADDGIALAAGETALARAMGKRTTLTWTPPDGWAPTSVFDIETSKLEPETNDLDELRLERVYGLRFWCLPFTRSVAITSVSDTSVTAAMTETVLDACSATTGWTASNVGPATSGGKVNTSVAAGTPTTRTLWLSKSFTLSDASRPYLRVKWSTTLLTNTDGSAPTLTVTVDGAPVTPTSVDGGTAWFEVGTPGTVTVKLATTGVQLGGGIVYYLYIDEVALTNVSGTVYPNIKSVALPIGGAARTPATITVSHATTDLGATLLYTCPQKGGYQPILHGYRTGGGGRTTTGDCVSGGREPLNDGPTYTIPSTYLPAGSYVLVARMRTTGAAGRRTVTWEASTSGTSDGTSGTCYVDFDTTDAWQIVVLDRVDLPPSRLTASTTRDVVLTLDSPDTDVQLDVALACHDDGALSIVGPGSGFTSMSAIPPSVDSPSDWIATDDIYPEDLIAIGRHVVEPSVLIGTVITDGVASPVVSADYFKTWLTHAME